MRVSPVLRRRGGVRDDSGAHVANSLVCLGAMLGSERPKATPDRVLGPGKLQNVSVNLDNANL